MATSIDSSLSHPCGARDQQAVAAKLGRFCRQLCERLVDREGPVRLGLLAVLSGEHILMVGPPGTAKSQVAQGLCSIIEDARYFQRLLTRFSVPEELFGPLSLKSLKEDAFVRKTQGYMPQAHVAFLDEVFNANSAILNSLLTLINERCFDNGASREQSELMTVVGASNALPAESSLDALFDRFLIRCQVGPVHDDRFSELLGLEQIDQAAQPGGDCLSRKELEYIRAQAQSVEVPEEMVGLICEFRVWCNRSDIPVSDRRWLKIMKLLKVSAWTQGRPCVSIWDLWLVIDCVWSRPEQRVEVLRWYRGRVCGEGSEDDNAVGLTQFLDELEKRIESDRERALAENADEGVSTLGWLELESGSLKSEVPKQKSRDPESRYLAPPNSATIAHHAYRWVHTRHPSEVTPIKDRENGGEGFTVQLLNRHICIEQRKGFFLPFHVWEGREAYLSDTRNIMPDRTRYAQFSGPIRQGLAPACGQIHESCLRDVRSKVSRHLGGLECRVQELSGIEENNLWIDESFLAAAKERIEKNLVQAKALDQRVDQIFERLQTYTLPRMEVASSEA